MFETALAANLPVIGVRSDDPVNFEAVLHSIAESPPKRLPADWKKTVLLSGLYWTDNSEEVTVDLYRTLAKASKQLVVLNPERSPLIFDAGELPTPTGMMSNLLASVVSPESVKSLLPALRGLSLKTASEVIAVTQARSGSTSVAELRRTRQMILGSTRGLSSVDTTFDFYDWPDKLQKYMTLNAPYFLASPIKQLVPRGVLLEGSPGVGKSMAAKAIAAHLEVPLYHLEIATVLGKYVGESEHRLSTILTAVERESPCVLLIDEVEKIFSQDDSGVTQRILSQLLWWLAEHTSSVLTVMTTNNLSAIPPELYRAGRIDLTMKIPQLPLFSAGQFAVRVFTAVMGVPPSAGQVKTITSYLQTQDRDEFAHAFVVEAVYTLIKQHHWI